MLIWIAVTAALLLVGCGTEHAAPTTTSAIPTTSAAPTTTTVSPREWAQPSLQYSEKVAALFPTLEADFNELGRSLDLRPLKSTAAEVANGARDWRIALQAAGPPPDEIAVEGRALIETLADLETTARNVATCIGLDACTAAVSRFNTAIASVTGALSAVNPKL